MVPRDRQAHPCPGADPVTIVIDHEMTDSAVVSRSRATVWLSARLDRRLHLSALDWALNELEFRQGPGWAVAPKLRVVPPIPTQRGLSDAPDRLHAARPGRPRS